MDFGEGCTGRQTEIADLFATTFAASEGAEEGAAIGELARNLMARTPALDLDVFTAEEDGRVTGAILFSRLAYPEDARAVFVLGPVAVATDRQGQGIGKKLIRHGLQRLAAKGVDVALTYGDPRYYTRVGFASIREADIPAPFPLSHPEGWLGQSLTGAALSPLKGPATC